MNYNIFAWVFDIVKQFKPALLRIFFISLTLNLLTLVTPVIMMTITDRVIVYRGFNTLQILILGLLLSSFFEIILTFIRSYILTHSSLCITLATSAKLYNKLLAVKTQYFDTRPVGEVIKRIQEVHSIKDFLISAPIFALLDITFALVFLCMLFLIEPYLSLVIILTVPAHIIVTVIITKLREFYLNEQFRIAIINQNMLIETLSSIQLIKLMSIEDRLKEVWSSHTTEGADVSFKIAKIEQIGDFASEAINKISTILILYIGANKVMSGHITFGTLLAFNSFSGYVVTPLVGFAELWKAIQQLLLSSERLKEIFTAPTENTGRNLTKCISPIQGKIKFNNVSFRYPNSTYDALSSVNIDISPGEIIGIAGRSGSGKTSLVKLIQGLYTTTRGQVLIDDYDTATVTLSEVRKFIGSVPQESFLFSRTIAENIAIGKPDATAHEIQKAARMAGINDFIESLPLGYDTVVEERGMNLSGGQRQRMAIARTLILNPSILIFDEATSALDYESEKIIHENMKLIAKNRTVIIISHRLEAFKLADRIFVLDSGAIIEEHKDAKLFIEQQKINHAY